MTTRTETLSWRNEIRRLLALAGPLIVNNLTIAGMQFADAVMSGRLGADALAAVAIGGSVWFLGFTICMGMLMAISPIAARHFGARNPQLIGRYTRQGMYLGAVYGVVLCIAAQFAIEPLLTLLTISPEFRDLSAGYIRAITYGGPAIFVFLALRFTTEGIGETKPIMYTSLLALVCNVFLNWVLMFGNLGAPALGVVGCGLASAITMWLIAFVLASYMLVRDIYKPMQIFSRLAPIRANVLREIVALGLPIAVMITAEAGLFSAISLMMGTRGTAITAAHQIGINLSATTFMIPLALSSAITIRVGHELGAGNFGRARYAGGFGIGVCAGFMMLMAVLMLLFREYVVMLYTDDAVVRSIAVSILFMAALFQVADGIQIGAAGALRGYKDTRVPMVINTFSYWVLAAPLAFLAAIAYELPPNYVWGGVIVGLSVAAMLLSWRYVRISHPDAVRKGIQASPD